MNTAFRCRISFMPEQKANGIDLSTSLPFRGAISPDYVFTSNGLARRYQTHIETFPQCSRKG